MKEFAHVGRLLGVAMWAWVLTAFSHVLPSAPSQRARKAIRSSLTVNLELLLGIEVPKRQRRRTRSAPLRGLARFADLFGLQTRKAIQALAGDYAVEVRRLRRERRRWMARWNVVLAWGYAAWYVLRSPVDWVVSYVLKSLRGSSQ
jgi:hypothetical protein